MTPAETARVIDHVQQARDDEWQLLIAQAWHTAAFGRVKKLRPLRHYLQRSRAAAAGPPPDPTVEEQRVVAAAADMWLAQLNGKG